MFVCRLTTCQPGGFEDVGVGACLGLCIAGLSATQVSERAKHPGYALCMHGCKG